jgi:hypothetical protein
MEGIKKAMNKRNLNEGQWEDRKQWSLGVGQRGRSFETDTHTHTHTQIYTHTHFFALRCSDVMIYM